MSMIAARKLETARQMAQTALAVDKKVKATQRRKKMDVILPVPSVPRPACIEVFFNDNTLSLKFNKDYAATCRAQLAQFDAHKLDNLLAGAQAVMDGLDPVGIQQMRAHSTHISFAFAHSRQPPVDFLTKYFSENPAHAVISKKFIAARWTEQFEATDLHDAYLNAVAIGQAVMFWNQTTIVIPH